MGAIDRRKHDIDVMERVLGAHETESENGSHTEVVDLGVRPWLAGVTTSVVQVTVSGSPPDVSEPPSKSESADDEDPYESDRRGEHRYPDTDELRAERPSHQEREALRSRLRHHR